MELTLCDCVTLGKFLSFFEPPFLQWLTEELDRRASPGLNHKDGSSHASAVREVGEETAM
jgi:hypothetical protein